MFKTSLNPKDIPVKKVLLAAAFAATALSVQAKDIVDTAVAAGAQAIDSAVDDPPFGLTGLACATQVIDAWAQVSV